LARRSNKHNRLQSIASNPNEVKQVRAAQHQFSPAEKSIGVRSTLISEAKLMLI
jgi:hypothetical protein